MSLEQSTTSPATTPSPILVTIFGEVGTLFQGNTDPVASDTVFFWTDPPPSTEPSVQASSSSSEPTSGNDAYGPAPILTTEQSVSFVTVAASSSSSSTRPPVDPGPVQGTTSLRYGVGIGLGIGITACIIVIAVVWASLRRGKRTQHRAIEDTAQKLERSTQGDVDSDVTFICELEAPGVPPEIGPPRSRHELCAGCVAAELRDRDPLEGLQWSQAKDMDKADSKSHYAERSQKAVVNTLCAEARSHDRTLSKE